ncbi:uncharacterized protein YigE (DUF2233 family) [Agrobacterium vitis]|nr:uncharacterized protein YigE (DUF2233 family) [Agrobacterium vitis]MBE1438749.1 uncharacterized protein YigE (DUF2233 family) [Agrobacterium vitis]
MLRQVAIGLIFSGAVAHIPARASPVEPVCHDVVSGMGSYRVCRFDPAVQTIRIYNTTPDGVPLGGFYPLVQQLWAERHTLLFATNGGMYEDDLSPVGLFVSYGVVRKPAKIGDGWGNFFLKPNGVFYLKDGKAGVAETQHFLDQAIQPDFATQSGPMLVIDGAIHPKFLADSDSLKIRNGVGVDRAGQVVFAMSNQPVRFYDMAVFFRDQLATPNALFLDGTISSLAEPTLGRMDRAHALGPIIAVIGNVP